MVKNVVLSIFILSSIVIYGCGTSSEDKSIRIVHVVPGSNNKGHWYSVYVYVPKSVNDVNGMQLLKIANREIENNNLDRPLRRVFFVNCDLKDAGAGTSELNTELVGDCYLMDFSFDFACNNEFRGINTIYGELTPELLTEKELKSIVFN